jgi:hypothetical protein
VANSLNCFMKSNLLITPTRGWLERMVRRIRLFI